MEIFFSLLALVLVWVLSSKVSGLKRRVEALEARPSEADVVAGSEILGVAGDTPAPGSPMMSAEEYARLALGGASGEGKGDERDGGHVRDFSELHYGGSSSARHVPDPSSTTHPAGPDAGERFVAWVKEDWLLKLGAFLLLIAFGWLASYAFINNWIGPMGRIGLGVVLGAGIMVLGWWRMHRFAHQGAVFLVLGSTVVILTIYAARAIYDFFDPISALGIMFITAGLVAYVSVIFRRRPLAIASLILAAVAPMLVNSFAVFAISQFTYLFVVVLGTIWVVAITRWRILNTIALAIVTLYSLPSLMVSGFAEDLNLFLLIAFAFAALFFVSNVAGIIRNPDRQDSADIVTALWNGLLLLAWIIVAVPTEWQSLVIVAWMLVFVVAAFLISKHTERMTAFTAYAAVAVVMLGTATAIELEGAILTIAFTLEAAALTWALFFTLRDPRTTERAAYTFALPVLLSLPSFISARWMSPNIIHADLFVLLILGLIFMVLGSIFHDHSKRLSSWSASSLPTTFFVLGSVYILALVWLIAHALLPADLATMLSLLIYTLIGLAAYFAGRTREYPGLTTYGGFLLGLVVVRLILVDVWKLEITGRILTFFVIGALLTTTAFLGRVKKQGSAFIDENK